MIRKTSIGWLVLVGIIVLTGLSVGFLNTSVAGSTSKSRTMLPCVLAIPNVGEPEMSITCYGANFKPGEKVRIVMMVFPDIENVLGGKAEGLGLKVDKFGSFSIETVLPGSPGIYPIRVYDEEDTMIASTLVVVKEKKKKE